MFLHFGQIVLNKYPRLFCCLIDIFYAQNVNARGGTVERRDQWSPSSRGGVIVWLSVFTLDLHLFIRSEPNEIDCCSNKIDDLWAVPTVSLVFVQCLERDREPNWSKHITWTKRTLIPSAALSGLGSKRSTAAKQPKTIFRLLSPLRLNLTRLRNVPVVLSQCRRKGVGTDPKGKIIGQMSLSRYPH